MCVCVCVCVCVGGWGGGGGGGGGGDESEAVVDAQKEEVFFPDLLITLRRHADHIFKYISFNKTFWIHTYVIRPQFIEVM